jgi:hypothetical protein
MKKVFITDSDSINVHDISYDTCYLGVVDRIYKDCGYAQFLLEKNVIEKVYCLDEESRGNFFTSFCGKEFNSEFIKCHSKCFDFYIFNTQKELFEWCLSVINKSFIP